MTKKDKSNKHEEEIDLNEQEENAIERMLQNIWNKKRGEVEQEEVEEDEIEE